MAVLRGESRKVQQLVAQQLTVDEDTCVEAHTLGSQPVVDALSSATPPLSRENLIIKVMKVCFAFRIYIVYCSTRVSKSALVMNFWLNHLRSCQFSTIVCNKHH